MKILVTGAAGYIGSTLVGTLLGEGHRVEAFDDLSSGSGALALYVRRSGFSFTQGDVRSERDMAPAIRRADAIIPLAAIVGMPACERDPSRATATNVDAIRLLMRARSREQRVLFPMTNSGYGAQAGVASVIPCTETTPLTPISLYGRLKCEAEQIALAYENVASLRLATIFGFSPRMRRDLLVNDFVWRALRDRRLEVYQRDAMRNYVHVIDVAHAFSKLLDLRLTGPFNFGNDDANMSKWALAEAVRSGVARAGVTCAIAKADGADPDRRNYIVSSERLRVASGIKALVTVDEGIRELVAGYRMLPELYA